MGRDESCKLTYTSWSLAEPVQIAPNYHLLKQVLRFLPTSISSMGSMSYSSQLALYADRFHLELALASYSRSSMNFPAVTTPTSPVMKSFNGPPRLPPSLAPRDAATYDPYTVNPSFTLRMSLGRLYVNLCFLKLPRMQTQRVARLAAVVLAEKSPFSDYAAVSTASLAAIHLEWGAFSRSLTQQWRIIYGVSGLLLSYVISLLCMPVLRKLTNVYFSAVIIMLKAAPSAVDEDVTFLLGVLIIVSSLVAFIASFIYLLLFSAMCSGSVDAAFCWCEVRPLKS